MTQFVRGAHPTQVIELSAGANEATLPTILTELTGADISADQVVMVLGTQAAPGTPWVALTAPHSLSFDTITAKQYMIDNPGIAVKVPDGVDPANFTLHQAIGTLFIGGAGLNPTLGDWWPYIKITDTPSIAIRRGQKFTVT